MQAAEYIQRQVQTVRRLVDATLQGLTDEQRLAADVITTFVAHTLGHVGEIAALRGVQGVKGLPF